MACKAVLKARYVELPNTIFHYACARKFSVFSRLNLGHPRLGDATLFEKRIFADLIKDLKERRLPWWALVTTTGVLMRIGGRQITGVQDEEAM